MRRFVFMRQMHPPNKPGAAREIKTLCKNQETAVAIF